MASGPTAPTPNRAQVHSRFYSLDIRWQRRVHVRHCYPPRELVNGEFETRFCNVCPIWRWPDIVGNAFSDSGGVAGASAAGAASLAPAERASAASAAASASAGGADGRRRWGDRDGRSPFRRPSAAAASQRGRHARGRGPAAALLRRRGVKAASPTALVGAAIAGKRRCGKSQWRSPYDKPPLPLPFAAAAVMRGACHLRAAAGGEEFALPRAGRCHRPSRVGVTTCGAVAASAVDRSKGKLRKLLSAPPLAGRRAAPGGSGGGGGDGDSDVRGRGGGGDSGAVAGPDRQRLPKSESDAESASGAPARGRTSGDKVWRLGVSQLGGAWPLSCGQHTPGGRPKLSRSGPARE